MSLLNYQPTREERQLAKERTRQNRQDAELSLEQGRRERQIDEKANLQRQLARDRAEWEELEEGSQEEADLESWIEALGTEIAAIEE